jgi:hypothetical protein
VLHTVGAEEGEVRVHHVEVRIEPERGAEVERAAGVDAVEPVAVVGVRIARRAVGDRLGRLVDREVVEARQHGGSMSVRGARPAARGGRQPVS